MQSLKAKETHPNDDTLPTLGLAQLVHIRLNETRNEWAEAKQRGDDERAEQLEEKQVAYDEIAQNLEQKGEDVYEREDAVPYWSNQR